MKSMKIIMSYKWWIHSFKWVRLGSFHQSSVSSYQSLVHSLKWVRAIWVILKMGSFVHFLVHPDVSGFRFAQHADFLTQMSLRMQETQIINHGIHGMTLNIVLSLEFIDSISFYIFVSFSIRFSLRRGSGRAIILAPPYIGANLRKLFEMAKWRGGLKR